MNRNKIRWTDYRVAHSPARRGGVALVLLGLALGSLGCSDGEGEAEGMITLFPEGDAPETMAAMSAGSGSEDASGSGGPTGTVFGGETGTVPDENDSPDGSDAEPAGAANPGSANADPASMDGAEGEGDDAVPDVRDGDQSESALPNGSYAVRVTQRDTITVGLVGSGSMRTVVLATAEIEEGSDEHERRLKMTLCDYRVATDPLEKHLEDLELSMPSSAISAAVLEPATMRFDETDAEVTWETTEVRGVAGWRSSSPSDALPPSAEDARLLDQDDDGQPGITVVFTGHEMGELYLAMVFRWVFSGTVSEDGELVGSTVSQSRETLLGSDQSPLVVTSFERVPDSDPTDNTVRFVPQRAGFGCLELLTRGNELFP